MREFFPSGEEYLISHIIFMCPNVTLGLSYVCSYEWNLIFPVSLHYSIAIYKLRFPLNFGYINISIIDLLFPKNQFKFYYQHYILSTFPGACHCLWQFFFTNSHCPYLLSSILGSLNIWFAYSEMYFIWGNGFLNAAIMGLK